MVVDALLDKAPKWLSARGETASVALMCQCALSRNFGDLPFPARCSEEERALVEERVVSVLDGLNLLTHGQYYALHELPAREVRFLAERRLITYDLMCAGGPRGVYVSDDQGLCIMTNGADHLCNRAMQPGLQLQEAWARLNLMDDTLSGMLDFVFNERLGFLTSELGNIGTGLKVGVLLHLPALTLADRILEFAERASGLGLQMGGAIAGPGKPSGAPRLESALTPDQLGGTVEPITDQALYNNLNGAVSGTLQEAVGDLFVLSSISTLGSPEEEIVFQVRHMAQEIVREEQAARALLLSDTMPRLEDQIGRAAGVAAGARLLEFEEGVSLLSSLRLGVELGVLPNHTLGQVNELLLAAQGAHIEVARGRSYDAITLNKARADLFRSTVAGN